MVTDTLDGLPEGASSQTVVWDLRSSQTSQPLSHPGSQSSARLYQPLAHLPQQVSQSTATALDPAAPILATGDADGVVRLWSLSRPGQFSLLHTMTGTTAPQSALSFSPDGHTLASFDANNNVHLSEHLQPQ